MTALAARLPADAITHTPGPWRVLHRTGVFPTDNSCYSVGTAEQHRKEAGANAALMAAAPDLLAACQAQLRLIEDMSHFIGRMTLQDYALFNEAPILAAAAIARATGTAS